jgi:hypothetical protein
MRSSLQSRTRPEPPSALTLQFLAWVEACPRSYAEAIDAWRSTCPRLSIWEDAVLDGLVRFDNADRGPRSAARVVLTPRGRALLGAGNNDVLIDRPVAAAAE